MALAIGYVPWQQWCKVYDLCKGLERGTIFPPLDLPFYGCIPRGYFKGQGGAQ
ncbi:MAG: spore coat associated protein CotJA [Lachnospiraceae bacterium]